MGLISKEAEVVLSGASIKRYEDMGYTIPRRIDNNGRLNVKQGTKILVKIEDLPKKSTAMVKCKCDGCGIEYEMMYCNYVKQYYNHKNKIYCLHCNKRCTNGGENAWNWNPNKTNEERALGRTLGEHNEWTKKVLARDNYKCIICGSKEGIEAHHLNAYHWCVEGRTDVTNGVCLCGKHHKNFHSIYGKGNNTKEQFEEYINNKINPQDFNGEIQTCKKMICLDTKEIIENPCVYLKQHKEISSSRLYGCCNKNMFTCHGKHYLYYDEYEKMSEEDVCDYLYLCDIKTAYDKPVLCTTTMQVFVCQRYAGWYFDIDGKQIGSCCMKKPKFKTTGSNLPNKERLEWVLLYDYMKDNNLTSLKEVRKYCTLISVKECKSRQQSRNLDEDK